MTRTIAYWDDKKKIQKERFATAAEEAAFDADSVVAPATKSAKIAKLKADIAVIEDKQLRATREIMIGARGIDVDGTVAQQRLRAIESQIELLRVQIRNA